MPPIRRGQIESHEIHHTLDCTPVVNCSCDHHEGNSTIWLVSTPVLRDLGVVRGLPSLFPFHQRHERTYGLIAI
ncbi:hypothetical protein TNCV_3443611 [Trichonephila clavipes]|nr:hypothetical protein TNCV_3443611 [Trichonephila clavipes]